MKLKSFVHIVLIMSTILLTDNALSQVGYAKDSLQIKAYTVITYENNEAVKIELNKVFCDYCSDLQKEAIGNEAKRRTYFERYLPENRLMNGQKKLALYIRVSKKDFAAIKEEQEEN